MATPEIGGGMSGLVNALGGRGKQGPGFTLPQLSVESGTLPAGALGGGPQLGSGVTEAIDTLGIPSPEAGGGQSLLDLASSLFGAGKDQQATEEEGAQAITDAQKKKNLGEATFAEERDVGLQSQVGVADAKIAGILSQGFGAGAAAGLVRKTSQALVGSEDEASVRRQDLELARSDQLAAQDDLTAAQTEQSEELADIRESQLDDINASNEVAHQVFKDQATKQRALLDEYQAAKQRYVDSEIGQDPSTSQQIASSVAIAIGAFGAAMRTQQTGVPAVNMAAQVIQQNIDNQLRLQQLELQKAGRVVGFSANAIEIARGIFSDERSSLQAARVMLTQAHIAEVKFVTQRTNSPIVRAQGEKLAADLTATNADADNKLAVGQMEKAKDRATAALQTDAGQRGSAARARGNAELQLAIANLKAAQKAAASGNFGQLSVKQATDRGAGVRQAWEDIKFLKKAVKAGIGVGFFESAALRPTEQSLKGFTGGIRSVVRGTAQFFGGRDAVKVNQKYVFLADTILRLRSGAQASLEEAASMRKIIGAGAGATDVESQEGIKQAEGIFLNQAALVAIGNPVWAMENFGSEMMSTLAAQGRLGPRVMKMLGMM